MLPKIANGKDYVTMVSSCPKTFSSAKGRHTHLRNFEDDNALVPKYPATLDPFTFLTATGFGRNTECDSWVMVKVSGVSPRCTDPGLMTLCHRVIHHSTFLYGLQQLVQ